MSVEQNIKNLILNSGYTIKSFAEKIDIPYTTLVTMLNGSINKSSINNVIKVAKGLNLSVDALIQQNENLMELAVRILQSTDSLAPGKTVFDAYVEDFYIIEKTDYHIPNKDLSEVVELSGGEYIVQDIGIYHEYFTFCVAVNIMARVGKSDVKLKKLKATLSTEKIFDQVRGLCVAATADLHIDDDLLFFGNVINVSQAKQNLETIICEAVSSKLSEYFNDTEVWHIAIVNNDVKQRAIKENESIYNTFSYIENVSAGTGYTYGDNETFQCYTDRSEFKLYDFATRIKGDSMEPQFKDGDIILVKSGYDNVNGGIYVIDYAGESYVKKLYNDGDRFRLVSINRTYENITIDIPTDDDVFFNIVGKVVDSFTPLDA